MLVFTQMNIQKMNKIDADKFRKNHNCNLSQKPNWLLFKGFLQKIPLNSNTQIEKNYNFYLNLKINCDTM